MRVIGKEQSAKAVYCKSVALLLVMTLCSILSVSFAFASNPTTVGSDWNTYLNSFQRIVQTVALAGGAVGLGWCGVEYAYGSEEVSNKAKSKAFAIFVGAAALYALPWIIRLGVSVGKQYSWTPSDLQ